jgi:hypothetical protein
MAMQESAPQVFNFDRIGKAAKNLAPAFFAAPVWLYWS